MSKRDFPISEKPPTRRQPTMLHRKCACGGSGETGECEQCRQQAAHLRRAAATQVSSSGVPASVHEVLRSPGQPLDAATRAFMEPRFGHDFGNVRVHSDNLAAESAAAVNAHAYTLGNDIVFGRQQYMPNSTAGMKLIAHELAHTLQQMPSTNGAIRISDPQDSLEREAEAHAAEALSGGTLKAAEFGRQARPPFLARDFAPPQTEPVTQAPPAEQPAPTPVTETPSPDQGGNPACTPTPGFPPSGHCSAYAANAWWLPLAYVNNATCACMVTPNVPTANCVRKFLQDRLAATPGWLMGLAASQKVLESNPLTHPAYEAFVQSFLTPRIYRDHFDAYRSCCCPFGPAAYPAWIGVTTVPFQPCSLVGWFINNFGSCTGTPGSW